ncbi:hypothetical protein [[Mycoplasma] anseris]|uniref:Uncharacterized protein n=1 Tax=[Mycoplasma] anseris TaxID=92400 RepID=A0A2Z4NCY1_9BACT|nr:hypothetical protein [[Mycoplasma] anseris]AWX69325.1 hypothetical protein DP065_00960 [[Mycoplasma] anseris]
MLKKKLILSSVALLPLTPVVLMSAATNENSSNERKTIIELQQLAVKKIQVSMGNYFSPTDLTAAAKMVLANQEFINAYNEANANGGTISAATFDAAAKKILAFDLKTYLYDKYVENNDVYDRIEKFENFSNTSEWIKKYMTLANNEFRLPYKENQQDVEIVLKNKVSLKEELKTKNEQEGTFLIAKWLNQANLFRSVLYDYVLPTTLIKEISKNVELFKNTKYQPIYETVNTKLAPFKEFLATNKLEVSAKYDSKISYDENVNALENKTEITDSINALREYITYYEAKLKEGKSPVEAFLTEKVKVESLEQLNKKLNDILLPLLYANTELADGHNFNADKLSSFDSKLLSSAQMSLLLKQLTDKEDKITKLEDKIKELEEGINNSKSNSKVHDIIWWIIALLTLLILILLIALIIKKKKECKKNHEEQANA